MCGGWVFGRGTRDEQRGKDEGNEKLHRRTLIRPRVGGQGASDLEMLAHPLALGGCELRWLFAELPGVFRFVSAVAFGVFRGASAGVGDFFGAGARIVGSPLSRVGDLLGAFALLLLLLLESLLRLLVKVALVLGLGGSPVLLGRGTTGEDKGGEQDERQRLHGRDVNQFALSRARWRICQEEFPDDWERAGARPSDFAQYATSFGLAVVWPCIAVRPAKARLSVSSSACSNPPPAGRP